MGDNELFCIRPAVAEDAMAVAKAHVRSWQVGYRGLVPADYLDALRPEDRAGRYNFDQMNLDDPFTQVATDGDTICGHVTTGGCRDNDLAGSGEIWAIYVDPPRWGAGIGRRLMTAGCAQLHSQGRSLAHLWVITGNVRARRFYELSGWCCDGTRRTDTIGNQPIQEVRYQLPLGPFPLASFGCLAVARFPTRRCTTTGTSMRARATASIGRPGATRWDDQCWSCTVDQDRAARAARTGGLTPGHSRSCCSTSVAAVTARLMPATRQQS